MQVPDPAAGSQGEAAIDTITDPSRIRDSNVRQFLELWFAEVKAGRLPDKSFLDPLRLRFLLGSLSLLDIQKEPLRFRYRLVGTDIVQRLDAELTGRWLDDHPNPVIRALLLQGATKIYRESMPVYSRLETRALGESWLLEVVGVPLFDAKGNVAYIGAGQSFPPGKAERPPEQRDS